ncbi:MAG: hypothetical protein CL670_03915 [Balneola sp.]|jgi:hypothetical protein|nr:hypothetical protein [Balneola sp.]MBE78276.1 hypothetical protein [Balneola sp.]HBX65938.1 hypothetical protein [Balneolaceae bacterium]|tara:strand:- start:2695 stop:3117 length:423 start_codon:yes stop_codon:yes gene_type:complete
MGFFKNDKKGKPPHTWYPEILHWQEGDQVYCWNIAKAIGLAKVKSKDISKYISPNEVIGKVTFTYKSVDENGEIYLTDPDGILKHFEFWRFIKYAQNETLKSKMTEEKQKGSKEYMELISNFQKAYTELAESDNSKSYNS